MGDALQPATAAADQSRIQSRQSRGHPTFIEDDAFLGEEDSFEIELPLSTYDEEMACPDLWIGKALSDRWCVAESKPAQLEITDVELTEQFRTGFTGSTG